jgi:hypothetical protein
MSLIFTTQNMTHMKIESFLPSVTQIGDWIDGCISHEQINNMRNFYRMVISTQFFPDVTQDSLSKAWDHLGKLIELQILKIDHKI